MKRILLIVLLLFGLMGGISSSYAETWNEPWQKEILKDAQYFVLAKVLSVNDSLGAQLEITKYFGAQKLTGTIWVNHFSKLELMSSSGHGLHMNFIDGGTYYFFLSETQEGHYAIPTPTSGFAYVTDEKKVYATYRHSYHQALVPQEIYEQTYTEIWNYFRTGKFESAKVLPFIEENLNEEPATFEANEIDAFFLQHVALESAYLLGIPIGVPVLEKFITSENFHLRISGLQLLANDVSKNSKDYLFGYIQNKNNENFEKVIAIWSLSTIGGNEYKKKLKAIIDDLSDEETGFGGNIMDPRVGTFFPSPKTAVELLKLE